MTNCRDKIEINDWQKTANVSSHPHKLLNVIDFFYFIFSERQHTACHASPYKNFSFVHRARNELSTMFIFSPIG